MRKSFIIFDMDGVLIDTEKIYRYVLDQILERFSLKLSNDFFSDLIGISIEKGGAKKIIEKFNLNIEENLLIAEINERYNALARSVKPRDGIPELLEELKRRDIKVGVATSTSSSRAVERLQNADILYYIDILVTGNEVDRGKPNPEIYLKCLEKFQASAEQTIALEDSIAGVRAAVGAGILTLGIKHEFNDARSLVSAGAKEVIVLPNDIPKLLRYFE